MDLKNIVVKYFFYYYLVLMFLVINLYGKVYEKKYISEVGRCVKIC